LIVIADIDNTISSSWWREYLIDSKGWDAFHREGELDEPIPEMVELINALAVKHRVICLTGRPERWRGLTLGWLIRHGVEFHDLLMRPNDNYYPAAEVKLELARQHLGDLQKVSLVLEDTEAVAAAWRAEGITTLLVQARRTECAGGSSQAEAVD
jgi:beta-phosphoglucomutase-like phosphatase (HAD superfamily)